MTIENEPIIYTEDDSKPLRILIGQLCQLITKARDRELQQIGITSVQSAALFHILNIGKSATIGMLADRMLIESHTASGLVKRMATQGLIQIVVPKGMGNRKFLIATSKGKRCYKMASQLSAIDDIFSDMTPDQLQNTIKSFKLAREKILRCLSMENKSYYP
jgi:DNA-binding MarR family transcriptional regulator